MGLENQSLVATGESQCKDKYALGCVCVCQLSPEEGKRRNGTLERRLLSNEQKERMENLIKQMPGTPLLHDLQNRKGGRATEPVLRAEARPASMARRAGIYTPSTAPGGEERVLLNTGCTRATPPGAESMALHCPSADLPASSPFSHSPSRDSVPRSLFSR